MCYAYINNSKILFHMKPTKCAFRNKRDEKSLAIAIAAWDLGPTKPMGGMGFSDFLRSQPINSMKVLKILGILGKLLKINGNIGQSKKYRAI